MFAEVVSLLYAFIFDFSKAVEYIFDFPFNISTSLKDVNPKKSFVVKFLMSASFLYSPFSPTNFIV